MIYPQKFIMDVSEILNEWIKSKNESILLIINILLRPNIINNINLICFIINPLLV